MAKKKVVKKQKKVIKKKEVKRKSYQCSKIHAAQIISDKNLMELEVKYNRMSNIVEFKAMIDTPKSKEGLFTRVIHKRIDDGELIFEYINDVPYCEDYGTGPAGDVYDSIKLGKVL